MVQRASLPLDPPETALSLDWQPKLSWSGLLTYRTIIIVVAALWNLAGGLSCAKLPLDRGLGLDNGNHHEARATAQVSTVAPRHYALQGGQAVALPAACQAVGTTLPGPTGAWWLEC